MFDLDPAAKCALAGVDAGEHAEGRDTRHRAAIAQPCIDIVGDQIAAEREAALAAVDEGRRHLTLDAQIAGVGLQELEHRQLVDLVAGRDLIDIIVEPVGIAGDLEAQRPGGAARIDFAAPALFGAEIGVADFIGLGRDVRAVGEQLFGRRRTNGA